MKQENWRSFLRNNNGEQNEEKGGKRGERQEKVIKSVNYQSACIAKSYSEHKEMQVLSGLT